MAWMMGLLTASSKLVDTTGRLSHNGTSKALLDNTSMDSTGSEWRKTLLHWPTRDSSKGKGIEKIPNTVMMDNIRLESEKTFLHWPLIKVKRQERGTGSDRVNSAGKGTDRKGWKSRLFQWPFRNAKNKDKETIDVMVDAMRHRAHGHTWEKRGLLRRSYRTHETRHLVVDDIKKSKKTTRWLPWLPRGTQREGDAPGAAIPGSTGHQTNNKGWQHRLLLHWPIRRPKSKKKENGTIKGMFDKMKAGSKKKTQNKRIQQRKSKGKAYDTISDIMDKIINGPKKINRRFLQWPIRKVKSKRKGKRSIGVILNKMKKDSRRRKERRLLPWPIRKRKSKGRRDIYGDETVLLSNVQKVKTKKKRWTQLKTKRPDWAIREEKGKTNDTCDVMLEKKRLATMKGLPYSPIVKKKWGRRRNLKRHVTGDCEFDVSMEWDNIRKERMKQKQARTLDVKEEKTKRPMVKDYDVCYKVLLVGDANAGKTALLKTLIGNGFQHKTLTTVGMDFVSTIVEVDGARVKLQIWDTAGQERFRSMTRFQFRGTQGAILAYDISDRESFKTLEYWLKMIDSEIDQHNKEPIPVYLIGNKSDINKRQVSYKQAKQLAEEHLMRGYVETSAKTGRNVCEAFTQLGQAIIEINHPKLMDSYLDKFDREDKYEQKKKEAEALAQYQLQKRRSRIRLPSNISRAKSLEKRAQKCCTS